VPFSPSAAQKKKRESKENVQVKENLPRVLNVVMSCHAFDPESSAVPLSLFYAPPQPTIRPHPQINSSGRALFHRFEVQGVRKQGKTENENHALQNMYLIETEGLLWMLQ
jgi:hypothetical protein